MSTQAGTLGRPPPELVGGWEMGLLALMALLYLGGAYVNPGFFGSVDAFHALLRDAARYAVMAVGMTFVIVNKDLDLSVGSIYGLITVVFSMAFSAAFHDLGPGTAVLICLALGLAIGLINGVLVTILKVPAFIATLTMLLIGRGIVLGLTGGKSILYSTKAAEFPLFFSLGEGNVLGFNNQIPIAIVVAAIGAYVLGKTRWGYETFATGGNEQAAVYAGIPTHWVRIRAYLLSALCATIAGLMAVAQDKGTTSQSGLGAELIVIAAVIIGGASILGGRGRVIGSCLGAVLTVLIDKVLREGVPITRTIVVNDIEMQVKAVSSLPVGAVPVFLGLLLLVAVLIEPYVVRRRVPQRIWAWLRGRPPPPVIEIGGIALEGAQTKGTMAGDKALGRAGLRQVSRQARRARDHPDGRAVAGRPLAAPGLLVEPAQHVRDPLELHRARPADRRAHLCHRLRRHRPLGRGGARVRRRHGGLFPESARRRSDDRDHDGHARRLPGRRGQRPGRGRLRAAGVHRHARHVLHRPRACRLAGRRAAADRLERDLQHARPQARRHHGHSA